MNIVNSYRLMIRNVRVNTDPIKPNTRVVRSIPKRYSALV